MSDLSAVAPWDLVAEGYAEAAVEFFQGFNAAALEMVAPGKDDRILDVACGPGTLALMAAKRVAAVDALDFSENMIAILRQHADDAGLTNLSARQGDGQHLPHENESFDAAFSMFGLMFFPDRAKGYGELFRVLRPGGRVCVASWAPTDQSPFNQTIFGALRAIDPSIPEPKTAIDSLQNPDVLAAELTQAGFHRVEVHKVTSGLEFSSAPEFWEKATKGAVPLAAMKNKLGEDTWREKSKIAVEYVARTVGAFPAYLSSDAWLGIGTK